MTFKKTAILILLLVGMGWIYSVSFPSPEATAQQAEEGSVPDVEVLNLVPEDRRIWREFSGKLEAIDNVEVKPRVGGTITEILFEEDSQVKQGDLLFVIDPRPFEAAVASAKATLQASRSQYTLAAIELKRARQLIKDKHISESQLDIRKRDVSVANAAIQSAQAALKQAELDLEYANIAAPISGRIGRAEITVGNVIEAGANAPVLTRIVANDQLYAEFDVDERSYVQMVRNQNRKEMPVEMTLATDDSVIYKGTIHSFDNQLDTTSGTIRARAIFANTDGALMPGMYADIRLGSAQTESVLLIPEKAISTDQDKKYVYVVNNESKVEYRVITLGSVVDGRRIVANGLKAGEKVMINSLQRVRPGMMVNPVNSQPPSDHSGVIVEEAKKNEIPQ